MEDITACMTSQPFQQVSDNLRGPTPSSRKDSLFQVVPHAAVELRHTEEHAEDD